MRGVYHAAPASPPPKGYDLHIRLTDGQYQWLKDIADYHGLEMATVVRAILGDAIERSGRQREQRLGFSVDRLMQRPFEAPGKPPGSAG